MIDNFPNHLIKNNFIEKFDIGTAQYYRLSTQFTCYFDSNNISILKKEYNPELEKGGVIYLSLGYKDGQRFYNVEKIVFITNRSENPHCSYKVDKLELETAREKALNKNLIPLEFHSHPTKNDNIIFENFEYYSQLDTSDADKICRYRGITIGDIQLRLPDVLIVANGEMKNGLFVGFYSGLIAPLDFTERKSEMMSFFLQKSYNGINNYFDTPQKKIIGIIVGALTAIGIITLFRKFPKAILPTVITTAAVVPSIAYSSSDENIYFGISNGQSIKIILPKMEDKYILENEIKIIKLYEEWKQRQLIKKHKARTHNIGS